VRHLKRLRLFATEAAILFVGVVLSLILATLASSIVWWLGAIAFWSGVLLTAAGLFAFRRKHRAWKIQYDAEGYRISQVECKRRPARVRSKRIARRVLIWIPSLIAAFVLFFFPVVSHVLHPNARLTHYRIHAPWTFTIWQIDESEIFVFGTKAGRGRFGVSPYWGRRNSGSSFMRFSTYPTWQNNSEKSGETLRREFRLGNVRLICGQYKPKYLREPVWGFKANHVLEVECHSDGSKSPDLHALFYGREEDLPTFYTIVDSITP